VRKASASASASVAQDATIEAQGRPGLPLSRLHVGEVVWVRTLGEIRIGRVVGEGPLGQIQLADSSWIANTGRWGAFARGGPPTESEYEGPGPTLVGWGHVLACGVWAGTLPLRDI